MHTRRYTVLQQVICVKNRKKKELKPTLALMELYFINLVTKFTFMCLSSPPTPLLLFTEATSIW